MIEPAAARMTLSLTLACAFESNAAAAAGIRALLENGLSAASIRVGAADREKTRGLRDQFGVRDDLDAHDPLAGIADLAGQQRSSGAIDKGGAIGAAIGGVCGLVLGATPSGRILPVAPGFGPIADALLLLALGAIAGASLGGAFGPRRSSHVGYRIIDSMEVGAVAVVAEVPAAMVDVAVTALEFSGARDVLRIRG